jgi:hypothetical protein
MLLLAGTLYQMYQKYMAQKSKHNSCNGSVLMVFRVLVLSQLMM